MKIVATIQVIIITGKPTRIHSLVVIGLGPRSLIETVITLALDPIGVAFPPKPAPIARAQNNGARSIGLPSSADFAPTKTITGIIAAVNGILSIIALDIADTQMIATASITGSLPNVSKIHSASI